MLSNLFLALRHGRSSRNENNEYRGWSDGPESQLNNDGLWDAREAASFLCQYRTPIRKIICSPLGRAVSTASIVCTILGLPEFEIDARLKPLHVGDLAGKKKDEHPIDAYLRNKDKRFPNGETVNEFESRQHELAVEILGRIESGEILPGELLLICHVSNIMYWHNLQSNFKHEDYLHEKTDLVHPGGIVIVTDDAVLPIHKWVADA